MTHQEDRNYVAAWVDYKSDKIIVLERDRAGQLHRKRYEPPYYFYVPDEEGDYESIFGDKLLRAEFSSRDEYEQAKNIFHDRFESDIAPIKRILMDMYYGRPTPPVNYAFLDIEVDYSQKIGFAGPTNPYAPINAVTIYQSWTKKYITYALAPPSWTGTVEDIYAEARRLIASGQLRNGIIPEITICANELELLIKMCDALQDADILSGWNSEFFDIPYICERLKNQGGEPLLARIEHVGVKLPKMEMVNRFGTEEPIYKFTAKSHLDYMRLFQKFTFEGRTSYALGNILDEEVGIGKIDYDGTLEHLFNNNFPLFTCYNFRDVDGLVQLDEKFKFIALVNQMAHECTVDFSSMLGTVAYVETAIANHAHYVLKKIVHDKNVQQHDKVEGAIVLTPTPALVDWIGSVDIKSQYPNTIRSLNISPEKIRGQFGDIGQDSSAGEDAWVAIKAGSEQRLTLFLEDGNQEIHTAEEWRWELLQHRWAVSAFGTVFDQGSGPGIVAQVVAFWYAERKRLQSEKKKFDKLAKAEIDPVKKKEYEKEAEHYDLLQLTKKISMNSLYGALLNAAFRFGEMRMGASVTATGRAITTHMLETIEEMVTGVRKTYVKVSGPIEYAGNGHEYNKTHYITQRAQLEVLRADKKLMNPNEKLPEDFIDFESILYGDTDSCYFKTLATTKEAAIETADLVAAELNKSFRGFMQNAFMCQPEFDGYVEAGREVVAVRGLFQAKKKYMLKVVDLDGFPVDKMKTQGSEIKKADTPKIIQKFLKTMVDMILDGKDYDTVAAYVNGQRLEILKKKANVFFLGVARQVNNLDKYTAEYLNPGTVFKEDGSKLGLPGHVRATCNYNYLLDIFDKGAKTIRSGDKVLVYYVKPNEFKFNAIAIPAEFTRFPKWFEENFKVDIKLTESKMFDNKLKGIFAALGKDIPSPQSVLTNKILEF
jgi:DNA polymerase elongation subunit (family B)